MVHHEQVKAECRRFAERIRSLGFKVCVAASGTHGYITDDAGSRVVSFRWSDYSLSGNYMPPSRAAGTGWKMAETPADLRTADDVRRVLASVAPMYCPRRKEGRPDSGFARYATEADVLGLYGTSSGFASVVA